jgi:polyribonucleotide nucleotidyltransferase
LCLQATTAACRKTFIRDNRRVDGRKSTDIRAIDCQVQVLKRPHGSALFTRGETQSLGVVTLGTSDDAQRSESVYSPLEEKHFMLHYNMPGYSVGEPKRLGAPGRREVGHGNLAERALRASVPNRLRFPYSIRMVSEITESNGSSSMASVCSGTLAMLDAGVPLLEPVAGIAMGLIKEGNDVAILSDILGDEDALGDMDFKVAGGKSGITALQMDMKIAGVSIEVLKRALEQAREGRMHILSKMTAVLGQAKDLSNRAPRIEQIKIKSERIRDLIGPGGRNIKKIVADTGCKVDIGDEGVVNLASNNGEAAALAKRMIHFLTSDPEINEVYLGIVKKVSDFGAFVEIKPGVEGLVHISQLAAQRVNKVEDVVKEGDEVMVKVIEIDRTGRIKLSRKDAVGKEPIDIMKTWSN